MPHYESACGFCIQPLSEEQIEVLEARQVPERKPGDSNQGMKQL
jgi:hypothetical protein